MSVSITAKTLRIGITIGLHHAAETLWNNGIKQNAVFLAEALKNCESVRSVHLVNTTAVAISAALPWDQKKWPTVSFEQAKDALDVLIELGGQIDANQTDYLKQRGTRLVSYCCGFEYVHAMESILFDRPSFGYNLFVNQRYDGLWVIPQVAPISEHYFSTLRRQPTTVVPFVWHPMFVEERGQNLAHSGRYKPHPGARRLTVSEPNINVVKFCLYPILIAEEAYRKRPDLIAMLHVTNAKRLAETSKEFVALMNQLDIVRQHKATFLGRYDTPQFLSEMTDVVVSHQWENALNYFYLEVCWLGYPLVHNAHLCSDLGYFYPGNDVQAGCQQLLVALQEHDHQAAEYAARQKKLIQRFLPSHPPLLAVYNDLLVQLMATAPI